MSGDSSLMLRMTLTQCFKNLNCHSEQSEESQTTTFRKEPKIKNPYLVVWTFYFTGAVGLEPTARGLGDHCSTN